MEENLAVCIAREFGSGGREVGRLVAQEMGLAYYDRELLKEAAKKSGIVEEMFEKADERPTNSLLYSLSMAAAGNQAPASFSELSYTSNDRLQNYIAQVIREAAELATPARRALTADAVAGGLRACGATASP